jgi:hypothetical protein
MLRMARYMLGQVRSGHLAVSRFSLSPVSVVVKDVPRWVSS